MKPATRSITKPAVLVVTSTVVRGAVGGRAAGFALERLGFPVWQLATVTLPWHPGHGPASRIVPDEAAFSALVDDLIQAPRLGEIGGILTGYLGSAAQAAPVGRLIDAVKAARPDALYLCDPVIGDHGRLYVPEATAAAIRDELVPRADILTPNPTELGFLAGGAAETADAMLASARALGPARVAITSASGTETEVETWLVTGEERIAACHRRLEGRVPNGTGDLFAALLLGRLLEERPDAQALRLAAAGVMTALAAARELDADELPLALVQDALVSPTETIDVG